MLPISTLEQKINEIKAKIIEERRRDSLRAEAFRVGLCPDCGSDSIKCKRNIFLSVEKYSCRSCGSTYEYYLPDY